MADKQFHVGDIADVKVTLFDASGAETDNYDQVEGITSMVTDAAVSEVVDPDVTTPKQFEVRMLALSEGVDQVLRISLDGVAGAGSSHIEFESETYEVVPNDQAVSGTATLTLKQISPPPPE